jgi:hypothetical protein
MAIISMNGEIEFFKNIRYNLDDAKGETYCSTECQQYNADRRTCLSFGSLASDLTRPWTCVSHTVPEPT